MKKELHIYIFRHGETTYNRDKRFTGFHNPNLTKAGLKQAHVVEKKLKNKEFQAAFYTRLKRSKKTLDIILKYHPECKIIKKDDRIIERNYGSLNGTLHKNYIKNNSIDQFNKIHRDFYARPPKGESFSDVEKRVFSFIKDLKKFMIKNKVNVAISAHGNSIRLFRKIMEKAPINKSCKWVIPYDKVFHYKLKIL